MKRFLAMHALAALLGGTAAPAAEFQAVVAAGKSDRTDTPVFVEIAGRPVIAGVAVLWEGGAGPAQYEIQGENRTRIWWIVSDLPAGKERTYTLKFGGEPALPDAPVFSWKDSSGEAGKSIDLLLGDRPVLRYLYTPFDAADVEGTKKPFHHVFAPDGSRLITKGAGGLYPHHRGIYFGYNRCRVDGKTYDVWHCNKGEYQIHREVSRSILGRVFGGHEVRIEWNDPEKKPFVEEDRRIVAFRQSADSSLIEFSTTLVPAAGPVFLGGDRQHAGVQFRAAQEVAGNQKATRYLRPAAWSRLPADKEYNGADYKDLPWNALRFRIGEEDYTVVYLSDPANPDGAEFSERLYGRFGEFLPWELSAEKPLELRYRFWIRSGPAPSVEEIERRHADLADPPKVTMK